MLIKGFMSFYSRLTKAKADNILGHNLGGSVFIESSGEFVPMHDEIAGLPGI
jgi:hypothetical protein